MISWLSEISGFEPDTTLFLIVVLIILVVVFVLLNIRGWSFFPFLKKTQHRGHRLHLKEYIKIDAQRSLVLVQRDNVEHLLLVGGNTDILVERSIEIPEFAEFTGDSNDEKISKKEGTLSVSSQVDDKYIENSPNLETPKESPTLSTSTNSEPQQTIEVHDNTVTAVDEAKPIDTDPYKTVEVEMNKLLGGRDKNSTS